MYFQRKYLYDQLSCYQKKVYVDEFLKGKTKHRKCLILMKMLPTIDRSFDENAETSSLWKTIQSVTDTDIFQSF